VNFVYLQDTVGSTNE